jgi:hypothetical protein
MPIQVIAGSITSLRLTERHASQREAEAELDQALPPAAGF